jgi:hypothetical protein
LLRASQLLAHPLVTPTPAHAAISTLRNVTTNWIAG